MRVAHAQRPQEYKIAANMKSATIIDEIMKRLPAPAEVQTPAPELSPAPAPEPAVLSMRLVYSIPIDKPVITNPVTPPPKRRRFNVTPIAPGGPSPEAENDDRKYYPALGFARNRI